MRPSPGVRIINAILIAVVAVALTYRLSTVVLQVQYYPGPFVDWRTYENAFERLMSGGSIYAADQLTGAYRLTDMLLKGYAYPPASVPLFGIFQGYPIGLGAWLTLNLGLLLTALWALVSHGFPRYRVLAYTLAVMGLAILGPFIDGVVAANVNVGLAGIIGWIAVGARARWTGVLGGLGAVVKLFPGATALATSGDKLRSVAIAVAISLSLVLVTLPLVGIGAWVDFVKALTSATPDCTGFNSSIACNLAPSIGYGPGSVVGIAVGGLAALALTVVRQPFMMAGLAAIAVMAPANNLHYHYWTIFYVLVIASIVEAVRAFGHLRTRSIPLKATAADTG